MIEPKIFARAGGKPSTALREATSDAQRLSDLLEEKSTYEFRRNLLGLKPLGLILNAIALLASFAMAIYPQIEGLEYGLAAFLLVFFVAVLHAAYLISSSPSALQ